MTSRVLRRCIGCLAAFALPLSMPVGAYAKDKAPQAPISWKGGSGVAKFQTSGDTAFLTLVAKDGKEATLRTVTTVDDALAILADDRLAFAWPALLDWAGPDLHKLRDFAVVHAKATLDAQLHPPPPGRYPSPQSDEDTKLAAMRSYIMALFGAGRHAEAIALARQQMASPTTSFDASLARPSYTTLLAILLYYDGRHEDAIATLETADADGSIAAAWRVNIDTNLAAFLASSGKYEQALTVAERTEQAFGAQKSGFFYGVHKYPDSDVLFASIRACALEGLGRHKEAKALLATMSRKPSKAPPALSRTSEARLNALLCMHDATGLADELAALLPSASPADDLFLQFQPAGRPLKAERETVVAALAEPALRTAIAGHARILDAQFTPALEGWSQDDKPAAQ